MTGIGPPAPKDIDEYLGRFPPAVRERLEQLRRAIQRAAPEAEEAIRYRMPAFTLGGRYLVYFAAYKRHIGLYPAPLGVEGFEEQLAPYAGGRGTARFPLDEPLPLDLIARIVKYRADETRAGSPASGRKR